MKTLTKDEVTKVDRSEFILNTIQEVQEVNSTDNSDSKYKSHQDIHNDRNANE